MHILTKNIISLYKEQGKIWLKDLPQIIAVITKKWHLSELKPVGNLSFNYVLSGFQNDKPIILKLGLDQESLFKEAKALKAFEGYGAVRLLEQQHNALLLERAISGISLKTYSVKENNEKIVIACEAVQNLQQASLPKTTLFPYIQNQLKDLDKEWNLPINYLQKARTLRDQLLKNTEPQILLHGDLHHENILQNGEHWLVIDPKGVIGYSINEIWAFIMDVEKDTEFVANYFSFNLQEVRSWYFVQLILTICWNLENSIENKLFLELADKAYGLC